MDIGFEDSLKYYLELLEELLSLTVVLLLFSVYQYVQRVYSHFAKSSWLSWKKFVLMEHVRIIFLINSTGYCSIAICKPRNEMSMS